jgi:hypothetical protein
MAAGIGGSWMNMVAAAGKSTGRSPLKNPVEHRVCGLVWGFNDKDRRFRRRVRQPCKFRGGPMGRSAQRSKGGGADRRSATGDMSGAERPVGPPRRSS